MSRFDEHAEMRGQLALLLSGALAESGTARIMRHLATCADCAAEWERWQQLSGALRRLPVPQPSKSLALRTQTFVAARLERKAEQRHVRWVLVFVVLFSWVLTLLGWPLVRFGAGGVLALLDIHFRQMWLLFLIFSALTWLAGATAAILLSVRRAREWRLA
ncbi:MAG: anti-sigma factor family protein [Candidatus Acidiferrales bacterium]